MEVLLMEYVLVAVAAAVGVVVARAILGTGQRPAARPAERPYGRSTVPAQVEVLDAEGNVVGGPVTARWALRDDLAAEITREVEIPVPHAASVTAYRIRRLNGSYLDASFTRPESIPDDGVLILHDLWIGLDTWTEP